MKKYLSLLLVGVLAVACMFTGCAGGGGNTGYFSRNGDGEEWYREAIL